MTSLPAHRPAPFFTFFHPVLGCALGLGLTLAMTAPPAAAHDTRLLTNSQELAGPDDDAYYWQDPEIPVCVDTSNGNAPSDLDGYITQLQDILGRTWEKYSPVRFTGYEPCKEEWRGAKLIFVTGGASTGGIGTNLKDAIEVRLNPTFDAYTAVHEFGHVLGFGHGSRRIDTQSWCVKDDGGAQPRHVNRELTGWDPKSIMSYCACITDPRLDRDSDPAFAPTGWDPRTCHSNRPVSLSVADVIGLQAVYGQPEGWALGANEDGDQFGGAMTTGDFNGDGFTDLAVGAPSEDYRGARDTGAVFIYTGDASGALLPEQTLLQDGLGQNENGDRFGLQLVAADLDGDGRDTLIVAAPREDIANQGHDDSGALFFFYWAEDALQPVVARNGGPHRFFGFRLAAGDMDGDGRDEVFTYFRLPDGKTEQLLRHVFTSTTDLPRIDAFDYIRADHGKVPADPDTVEGLFSAMLVADVIGDNKPELVVGHGRARASMDMTLNSGFVDIFTQSENGLTLARRITPPGQTTSSHQYALFGLSLAAGDFNGDGSPDLAIGAPGASGHGAVFLYTRNNATDIGFVDDWTQSMFNTGSDERGDGFGSVLAAGDFNGDGFDDLAVTVPGEQVGRDTTRNGLVNIGLGSAQWLTDGYPLAQTPVDYDEDRDRFGDTMSVADLDFDGRDELIVGTPGESPGVAQAGGPRSGQVIVYRMPRPALNAWYGLNQQGPVSARD